MKKLLFVLFLLITCTGFCQLPSIGSPLGNIIKGLLAKDFLRLPVVSTNTLNGAPDSVGYLVYNKNDSNIYKYIGGGVFRRIDSSKYATDILAAGAFTTVPGVGFNPGTNLSPAQIIQAAYYGSQPPRSTIDYAGSTTLVYELMAAGAALPYTLNWSAGRNIATTNLQTIVITSNNGQSYNESFTQPSPGGNVSGTQPVTIPRNVTTTFTNTVTTVDGKIATSVFTASASPKRYSGIVTTTSPTDAQIIATNGELSTSRIKTFATQSSSPYDIEYSYPASEGDLTSIKVNTFESILAFTKTQRNFTNASGFTSLYNIYISNNQITVTTTQTIDAQ